MSTPETTPRVRSRRAWRIAIALTLVVILAVAATGLARSWWVAAVRSTYVAYFANTNGLYTGDDIRILGVTVGTVEKIDIWGRRRMAYEILKHPEGIYAVIDVKAEPATVSELDRQLSLNESVLRTKVMRTDKH